MVEHRPADPLEAGERLGCVDSVGLGHLAEQGRRHERGDDEPVVTAGLPQQVVGEQPADLVASQPPPRTVGLRDGCAEPVAVGVVRDRDVRAHRSAERHQQVHRARFLRVRERHRRERAVGLELLGDQVRCRQTGRLERTHEHRTGDAVHRRVDHRHPGDVRATPHLRDRCEVRLDQLLADRLDQRVVSSDARVTAVGSTRSIWAEMPTSWGGTIWAPSPRYTL
jgi:hypothetical protein